MPDKETLEIYLNNGSDNNKRAYFDTRKGEFITYEVISNNSILQRPFASKNN